MIEASPKRNTFLVLTTWHYYYGLKGLLRGWANFLTFTFGYFSVPLLLKTFFSHWRRYKDSYGRGFDPKVYGRTFFLNMISRCLGAFVRSVVIVVGLLAELFVFLAGLLVLIIWLVLPFLIIFGLYSGVALIV